MDPRNGILIAEAVTARLSKLAPAHTEEFKKRAAEFEAQLKAKITEWETTLKPYAGKPVVAYHDEWSYFTSWAGLNEIGTIESKPGVQPTPEGVVKLVALMKQQKARIILMAPYDPNRIASEIAKKTKASVIVARTEPGVSTPPKTYIAVFDELVGKLKSAEKTTSVRKQNHVQTKKPKQKSQPQPKPSQTSEPEPESKQQPNQNSI